MIEAANMVLPWWQAAVLGAVQGLGEFLPISSSAHLILTPWLMGWRDPGLSFDVALHVGTLVAVLACFGGEWLAMARAAVSPARDRVRSRQFWLLLAASVPGAVMGVLLEKKAESAFRSPLLIAATLAGMGVVLWVADRSGRKDKALPALGWAGALAIGVAQGLAVIPGVSRAGATISMALLLGLKREDSARFSFLLSTPIVAGAAALKLRHMLHQPPQSDLIIGTLVAAVVGLVSIQFLLRYLKTRSFAPFVLYRLALATGVAAVWFARGGA